MLEGQHTFAVDTLLGRRDDSALTVCARHMAEKLLDVGCTRQARLSFDPLPVGLDVSAVSVSLIIASVGVSLSVCNRLRILRERRSPDTMSLEFSIFVAGFTDISAMHDTRGRIPSAGRCC